MSASSAEIAAISSIRLLVVWVSPPLISRRRPPHSRIAPQPPGPGLPEQAPSVCITTRPADPSCSVNAETPARATIIIVYYHILNEVYPRRVQRMDDKPVWTSVD